MKKLSTYIEYLLMTRHYCYVPGKGAYMMVDEPASLGTMPGIGTDSRQLFDIMAPKRTVRFSTLHHHDDGILANLLMEAEGMTYDQACYYIQRQVGSLTDDFGELASLHTDVDNFGFETLKLETWADIEKRMMAAQEPAASAAIADSYPRLEIHRDSVSIPKYWLQRAAVALLIALFFFTDFIGLNRNNNQLASVLNISILKRSVLVHPSWDETDELSLDYTENTTIYAPDQAKSTIAKTQDITPVTKQSNSSYTTLNNTSDLTSLDLNAASSASALGPYYIIVASSRSEQEAERISRRYLDQGYNSVGILSRDGLHRVYLSAFANQAEATSYLREIRQVSERLSKAWMLTLKHDDSLSYIIKNIYNDNQLSMELSHPNQRTERDQG